jgi:hypothetical protein
LGFKGGEHAPDRSAAQNEPALLPDRNVKLSRRRQGGAMSRRAVHYELYARRKPNAAWTLELAAEDRAKVCEAAEEMFKEGLAAAVKVTKETLDPESGEFRTISILAKGQVEARKKSKYVDDDEPALCVTPQDLYTVHARDRIGRLLDAWLIRKRVTPFELLHRADLLDELETSGIEIQGALQKLAVAESQGRGASVHNVIRTFQKLVERAIERVLKDEKKGVFPDVSPLMGKNRLAEAADWLADDPERHYALGGAVARYMAAGKSCREKVGLVLDLAEQALTATRGRSFAFKVLEQPLGELLGSRGGLNDLLGAELELGASLAALTRMAIGREVEIMAKMDPAVAKAIPPLTGEAARVSKWLQRDAFQDVRGAIGRRVLKELLGTRRLCPGAADDEIQLLRALAMALTAAAGKMLTLEDVQNAFLERSKNLVTPEFVTAYLHGRPTALSEAQALVRLAENVTGGAAKRAAARWLLASVAGLKFETEMRGGTEGPLARLAILAELQRHAARTGLHEADAEAISGKIGEIGGLIEQDGRITTLLGRAQTGPAQKLTHLLRMAAGETAPLGPAADRAKVEAMKLLKAPETRADLAAQPELLEKVRGLMQAA